YGKSADGASGGARGRRDRNSGCKMGGAAARLRRAQGEPGGGGGGARRASRRHVRQMAIARPLRVPRRAAADLDRQILEDKAARAVWQLELHQSFKRQMPGARRRASAVRNRLSTSRNYSCTPKLAANPSATAPGASSHSYHSRRASSRRRRGSADGA